MSKCAKPCGTCPWRVNAKLSVDGLIGGSPLFVYLGQARTRSMLMPCHSDKDYAGKETDITTNRQCAGAANFRANNDWESASGIIDGEKSAEVFSSADEMLRHYYPDVTEEEVLHTCSEKTLEMLANIEMSKAMRLLQNANR